mmetsp:Transcript_16777/g.38846  ORF Transcript_16777/g.38846 Transcript_16777/m.38846 type:complete len:464 (+) Transcript_16777:68-1459(+)
MGAAGLKLSSEQVRLRSCTSCIDGLRSALSGKQTDASNGAVDAALLHRWRIEILQRVLPPTHLGEHVMGFIGNVNPPSIGMLSDGFHVTRTKPQSVGRPSGWPQELVGPPQLICAFAADVNGADIWLTVSDDPIDGIHVWPGATLLAAALPQNLRGLEAPAKSLWLSVAADRAAAGLLNGTVQIWDFSVGLLLISCQPIILESTQWTTVGHTTHVTMLDTAPSKRGGADTKYPRDLRAGKACVLSGDPSGTVCIWRDDGTCVLCCNACFVAQQTFGGKGHTVHSIASSTENLVICGLSSVVVAFTASLGEVAFVLSHAETSIPRDPIAAVQYIPCADDGGLDHAPCRGVVMVAKASGEILQWNLSTLEREGRYLQARRPKLLRRGRSSRAGLATCHRGELVWLGLSDCGRRVSLAWLHAGGSAASSEPANRKQEDGAMVFEKNYYTDEAMPLPTAMHLFPSGQ